MTASVTHTPKAGPLLTGTEYESASHHTVTITAADVGAAATSHSHAGEDITSGTVADGRVASTIARDSEVTTAVSDHAALADPHTGYRLESADHSHASSGLQGGQVAYSALTGTPAAERAASSTTPAAVGTAAVGTGTTDARADHVHATGAGTPSTQAMGDAAATGSGPAAAMTDHKHAMPALGTTAAAIGTSAGGSAVTPSKSDHVHATGAGTPSTQAFADAAATGTGPAAAMTDHKHAMPTLGYGLSGNATPAVGLTQTSAFATATTSISAATYADVTGVTVTLATGTWLVVANCYGSSVNAQAIMHVAITDASNAILAEGSQGIGASGTASVAQLGNCTVTAIVSATGAAIKMRAARGLTTITGTWVAMDGAGTNTTNNLTDNSDKGTGIFAIRIA